ncbi:porin [Thiosulfativibrio zosterae]|uniref:Porin n=1 Tax=Thiosulfativibrio zosterae TaxID=2675053 RepID=A0A6F8PL50_9GAMM|nr:porin [Thiosulfativibrio zosterae]BBP42815.1 porin [Thiosulfativibrio zosterae]
MKKNIIALAIASAIAAPVVMADAPTVYGQINMSIDAVTDAGMTVGSNASRFGIKGSEDLGNGLKAVYKIEWEADIAGGTGATTGASALKDRNAYAGLAGSFGTVLMGRHDTPMKMAQPTDTFNDGFGDNKPMGGKLGMAGAAGEVRAANVLAYVSPSFGGVTIAAAGVSPDVVGKDTALTNAYSIAAMYGSTKSGLFLSGAYNAFDAKLTGTKTYTEMRLAAQYAVAGLMGNVTYFSADDGISGDAASEGSTIQMNLSYEMGDITPKIKYSMVDYKAAGSDGSSLGLGLDYAMGKKTTAYVEYVAMDKNMATTFSAGKDSSAVSVGLLHKF